MKSILALLTAILLVCAAATTASAEIFLLKSGGQIIGEWLNRDESPRQRYEVQVVNGAKVTIEAAQVEKVLRLRPEEEEYERIRPTYADTATAQWELAQWCREHRLTKQRETHLQRVIELDPDHAEARHALGYSQVNGQWATRDEIMTERGYKKHKGQWKTQQEIDLIENKRKHEAAQQDWFQKLKRWRGWLDDDRNRQARENIIAIADPLAVKALAIALRDDTVPEARILYTEALAKIDVPEAARALAIASIFDPVDEVRLTCLDHLEKNKRPDVVSYYVGKLKDKDNVVVNRAAFALGRMKDLSSIGPLIDALVTVHKFKIAKQGGDGATTNTFGTGPGGSGAPSGMGFGAGGGPSIIRRSISNQTALDALVSLTGQNFNFDKQAWKYWLAAQKKPAEAIDARRD